MAFSDDQLTTMRQELGLSADADEATIMAAFTEALNERAEPTTQTATTMQLPAGVVAIDQAALDQLTAKAERGVRADEAMQAQHRDTVLQSAVAEGRIPPSRLPHYAQLWEKDPEGTEQHVTQLAKGVIPVTGETGHDHEGAAEVVQTLDSVREDPSYKSWSI